MKFNQIILVFINAVTLIAYGMDKPPLSPEELHKKLCVLNENFYYVNGMQFKQRVELGNTPFDLKNISDCNDQEMTPLACALTHHETATPEFISYLITQGAAMSDRHIMRMALNYGKFELIPQLMNAGMVVHPDLEGSLCGSRSIFTATIGALLTNLFVIENDKVLQLEGKKDRMLHTMNECIVVMKLIHSKGRSLDEHVDSPNPPLLMASNYGLVPVTQFLLDNNVSLFYGKKQTKRVVDYLKKQTPPDLVCVSDRGLCIKLIESKEAIANPVAQPTILEKLSNLLIK
jgi:hypothetical protein